MIVTVKSKTWPSEEPRELTSSLSDLAMRRLADRGSASIDGIRILVPVLLDCVASAGMIPKYKLESLLIDSGILISDEMTQEELVAMNEEGESE